MLIADAGLTLVWQEPISAVYAKFQQRELAGQLNDLENLTDLQLRALQRLRTENRRVAFLARLLRRQSEPGDAIGRIKIKRIGINFVVVEGTKPEDLRKGPRPLRGHAVSRESGARWPSPGIARPTSRRSASSTRCGAVT
jgi:sortase A